MKKLIALAAVLVTVAVCAVALQSAFGGLSFVTTRGISMQPAFFEGDLAIIRTSAGPFAVGDVVTYRSQHMDTVVMHRIVEIHNGRYTLQGDNNSWLDPEQPLQGEVLGELALRIPGGGIWLGRATSPAGLGGAAFFILVRGSAVTATRRRRRRNRRRTAIDPVPAITRQPLSSGWRIAAAGSGALALCAVGLGVASWTVPTSEPLPSATDESGSLTFSYSAEVARSAAYDETVVRQPLPVFRRLADQVQVAFAYRPAAPSPVGKWTAAVQLGTANGWRSTLAIPVATSGSAEQQQGRMVLDLSTLQARADSAARAIGDEPGGEVSVTVVPELQTADEPFRPRLAFILTSTALRLADTETSALTVERPGSGAPVTATSGLPTLALFGVSPPVHHVRVVAAAGLVLALATGGSAAMAGRRARRAPEPSAIQARYGAILLQVQPMVLPAGRPVVDVVTIAALARLAERYGLLVLHWDRGGTSTYVVLDDSTTYRYRTAGSIAEDTVAADELTPELAAPITTPEQLR